jgi:ribosomal protein S18 acetylase RimI-like enzyme
MSHPLTGSYRWEDLSAEQFSILYSRHYDTVFSGGVQFDLTAALSTAEREALQPLRATFANRHTLRIGIFDAEHFVGWHVGVQDTWDRFYMMNSGILPAHQGRGIYTALLPVIMRRVREKGFQTIYSRHHATNSAVLIPKLRAGFVITGFELSDQYGMLVHLSYHFNPLRRQALAFRSGERLPDAALRPLLTLEEAQA